MDGGGGGGEGGYDGMQYSLLTWGTADLKKPFYGYAPFLGSYSR